MFEFLKQLIEINNSIKRKFYLFLFIISMHITVFIGNQQLPLYIFGNLTEILPRLSQTLLIEYTTFTYWLLGTLFSFYLIIIGFYSKGLFNLIEYHIVQLTNALIDTVYILGILFLILMLLNPGLVISTKLSPYYFPMIFLTFISTVKIESA